MFDAEAAAEIISIYDSPPPKKRVARSLSIVDVYAWFNRTRETPTPEWLRSVVVSQPTEIDIHLAAQAWAEHNPGYLGDIMMWAHECPTPEDAMMIAAEIATVALYRVDQGLTGEPWAASVARLGGDLHD